MSAVGLDLNSPDGARILYSRLKMAAYRVCTRGGALELSPPPLPMRCFEDALGNAVRSVNRPQLSMIYLRTHTIEAAELHGINVAVLAASH